MLRAATFTSFLVLMAGAANAQQSITFEELIGRMPPDVAAEMQRRAAVAQKTAPPDEATRKAALDELRAKSLASQVPSTATVIGDASTSARCVSGYVAEGRYEVTAADVRIVAEQQRDCDAVGCRSFQVTTSRSSPEPYEVDVSVTCSG